MHYIAILSKSLKGLELISSLPNGTKNELIFFPKLTLISDQIFFNTT